MNRKTGSAIHQELSRAGWNTITQMAQNKETWPEFVDALCSSRDHGVKSEVKLENARTNPDSQRSAVTN